MMKRIAIVLLAAAPPCARAQDAAYSSRFSEEVSRKVAPIVTPAPTPEEIAAPRAPAGSPIDMAQAMKLMGVDALGPNAAALLPGGKLGIIDMGFRGLKDWLAAHPEERKLTTYLSRNTKPSSDGSAYHEDPDFSDAQAVDHGYWVYRVARAILPNVPIVLYIAHCGGGDCSDGAVEAYFGDTIIDGALKGVVVFNASLGMSNHCELAESEETPLSRNLRMALVQKEAFLFIAEGNEREFRHTWRSADANGNGYVDFRTAEDASRVKGSDLDGARVLLNAGENVVTFSWDTKNHPDDDYELRLETAKGEKLDAVRRDPKSKGAQCLALNYKADKPTRALVRVKRIAGPESGVLMRVSADGLGVGNDFNGLQTPYTYLFRDNPFVIHVGSFGKAPDGRLTPSAFSDVGRSPEGILSPDVLGPGELMLDGKEIDGTSFASPFLTALYATRVGYNLKNLVERSASLDRFDSGVSPFERSRWGIPDAQKVSARLTEITRPTKVEGVSHKIDGGNLVVTFSISRSCMQSMVWYPVAALVDRAANRFAVDENNRPIMAFATLRTEDPGYVRHPVELRFPLQTLERYKGRELELKFLLKVRAWQNPPPGSIKVDEAPVYRFTLGGGPASAAAANPLADAVGALVLQHPGYRGLQELYDAKKGRPEWAASEEGKAAAASLERLRRDAAMTAIATTPAGPRLQYGIQGRLVTDEEIKVSDLTADKEYREFIESAVASKIATNPLEPKLKAALDAFLAAKAARP